MSDNTVVVVQTLRRLGISAERVVELMADAQQLPVPRRRGGEPEWRRTARIERDDALKELARQQFGDGALSADQARTVLRRAGRKLQRARRGGNGTDANRDLMRRIDESGLALPGVRQFLRIIKRF